MSRVFVSYDVEHDGELYERLLAQSRRSSFSVTGGSERPSSMDVWSERARTRIRQADQVIVICGEHTDGSMSVSAELHMAQEEGTPYFLLWGRRELMCTKPIGAKSNEGMYSWTREILRDQVALTHRRAQADGLAEAARSAARKA